MDMSGEYRIPASREKVWAALNDPEVLKASIPGCESLEMASPTEMNAVVTAKVGPVKAKFTGEVTLSEINPPESYTISGEGKGGVAGFAKGGADVQLAEDGNETVLTYQAKAQVGGKLAQLGSRLIDSTAKKMADQFFSNFSEKVASASEDQQSSAADGGGSSQDSDSEIGHGDNLTDTARDIGEAIQHAEQAMEVEAGKNTFGGPLMWGTIALAILIAALWIMS